MPTEPHKKAVTLDVADFFGEIIYSEMPDVKWHFMGSYRRRMGIRSRAVRAQTMIGDHDILVVNRAGSLQGFPLPASFTPDLAQGRRQTRGHIRYGGQTMQVDFWACKPRNVGGFLLHGTGPVNLSIHVRQLAIGQGWKLNQYGLFDGAHNQLDDGTERDIFRLLGVKYLRPIDRDSWSGPSSATAIRITKKSRSNGPDHHVLLDGPLASCDCKHFKYRRTPCWAIEEARAEQLVPA